MASKEFFFNLLVLDSKGKRNHLVLQGIIANLVPYLKCGKWIHSRRTGIPKLLRDFAGRNAKETLQRHGSRKKSNVMKREQQEG